MGLFFFFLIVSIFKTIPIRQNPKFKFTKQKVCSTHRRFWWQHGREKLQLPWSQRTSNSCRQYQSHRVGDDNFAPPRLTRPSPLRPVRVFPAPQRWWGEDGVRFQTRTTGRDGDGFTLFSPTPPRPIPTRGIVLLNIQIILFSFC